MSEQRPQKRDKHIAPTGWGIKPDDQPANTGEVGEDVARSCAYTPDAPEVVKTILRLQRRAFNAANHVIVESGRTRILDVNGDAFVVEGLGFGAPHLVELLNTLGAAFDPRRLAELGPETQGTREYTLSRAWAWGAERTG